MRAEKGKLPPTAQKAHSRWSCDDIDVIAVVVLECQYPATNKDELLWWMECGVD